MRRPQTVKRKRGEEERGGKARKAEEAEGRGGQAQEGKGGRERLIASGVATTRSVYLRDQSKIRDKRCASFKAN